MDSSTVLSVESQHWLQAYGWFSKLDVYSSQDFWLFMSGHHLTETTWETQSRNLTIVQLIHSTEKIDNRF